jgi:glycosyltransferase involved in cell wall biosynthesis
MAGDRLRVVYLGHCAQLSGAELDLLRLLPALHEVDVHVLLAEDGPLVDRLRSAGMRTDVLPMAESARSLARQRIRPGGLSPASILASVHYVLRLNQELRRLDPDLVHTNTLKAALYGGTAARMAGVPVVWHVRDRIAQEYLPGPAARLVRSLARRLPAGIIANSRSTLESLRAVPVPTAVIPSAVSPQFRSPERGEAGSESVLVVGMVGRLAPWKGQHIFLDAFSRAFPTGEARAVLVGAPLFGEEAYEDELRASAARLGIAERLEMTGFQEDVAAQLRRFDVLVHASVIPEPFGQVVVEGMAAGLPVVATAAGGPAEVISDGVDGLLVAPGNAEALAVALRRLGYDSGLRASLGAAARQRATAYAPDEVAGQVLAFYRRLAVRH